MAASHFGVGRPSFEKPLNGAVMAHQWMRCEQSVLLGLVSALLSHWISPYTSIEDHRSHDNTKPERCLLEANTHCVGLKEYKLLWYSLSEQAPLGPGHPQREDQSQLPFSMLLTASGAFV